MSDPRDRSFEGADSAGIHRRFFTAGVVSLFTAGIVLGAVLLAMLAWRRDWTVLELRPAIWAHAHAQIAGWLAFFVMGFAYEMFPRWKRTPLPSPALAKATLGVLATGLILRVGAGFFDETFAGRIVGVVGGLLELAAVGAFLAIMAQTWRLSQAPRRPWERFVLAAFAWMALAFVADLAVFVASGSIRGERAWIEFIGLYDAPWRDIQLLGFAAGMVLGVGQRLLPAVYGFRQIPERRAHALFWLWNGAVAGQIAGYLAFFQTRQWPFALAWWAAVAAMGAVFATAAFEMRLFAQRPAPDRSLPFLRAAYVWAGVATVMLLALPLYSQAVGLTFSHAWFGAFRHALTVGFLSLTIVGVSSLAAPRLAGVDVPRLSDLRLAFWLLNVGCAMRVGFQVLTDVAGWAFPPAALSAPVEIAGFALWALDLRRTWRLAERQPRHAEARCLADERWAAATR